MTIFLVTGIIFITISFLIQNYYGSSWMPSWALNYSKPFGNMGVLFILIYFFNDFLTITTDINFEKYWIRLPYHNLIFIIYIAFSLHRGNVKGKQTDAYLKIEDIQFESSKPYLKIQQVLLSIEGSLERTERKLNLLKTFSPIPIILLLVSSLPDLFNKHYKNISLEKNDYINLSLVAIVLIYIYITIKSYNNCQYLSKLRSKIKKEILNIEYYSKIDKDLNYHLKEYPKFPNIKLNNHKNKR